MAQSIPQGAMSVVLKEFLTAIREVGADPE
jgi:hypothetical protein